jgi:hypothetical protein
LTYRWPIKPFDRQHPIRGNFGDPRTIASTTFGQDEQGSVGSFTFHNGIDISAQTGTRVYPVVSGTVKLTTGDRVVIVTNDDRTFQYIHLRPLVAPGRRVIADKTILGTVRPEWHHLHLTEIDGFRVHNPVDPGHLEPYRDHTIPTVTELVFTTNQEASLDPAHLHGTILIAAGAEDLPPLPVFPATWFDFPVTPALVAWRMTASGGLPIVHETIAADFRHTEPPKRKFWHVYSAGTFQNFPQFGRTYYYRHPGRYLFSLTKKPLDTRRLPNGDYTITVDATDICGNTGSLTQHIAIRN